MSRWNRASIEAAFLDAAFDPSRWSAAMETVSTVTEAYGAALFPIQGRLRQVPHTDSLGEVVDTYVRDGWVHRDERYRAWPLISKRGVATELDFTTPEEISRSPYYQEFLGRKGLRWFAGVRASADDEQWCLSIQRTITQGPFLKAENAQLAKLSSSLSSAVVAARAFGAATAVGALEAFGMTGSAVALLNRRGEVIRLNPSAEHLLCVDVSIKKRRLTSSDPKATAALDGALHALLWSEKTAALHPAVPLPRADKRPLLVYPARLSSLVANALSDCQAILVLVDMEARERLPEQTLRECFDLTAAEARLAVRIAAGHAIESIADELGISRATARTELKKVFWKTGVHRQAELVALLARLI